MARVTLFIKNIPADTSARQLKEFIESGFAWRSQLLSWLRKHKVVGIKILALRDGNTRQIEFHGLVTIEPGNSSEKIIKRLNLKLFRGRRVAVRRYYKRYIMNDRRYRQSEELELQFRHTRIGDRRRQHIEDTTVRTSAVDAFSRRLL